MKIFLVFILQNMSGNGPVHDYIFRLDQENPLDVFILDFIHELDEAKTAMYKSTVNDVNLALELRKAEAYVKELQAKSEIATKQRIEAKQHFDAVYAAGLANLDKITALSNSNA